MKFAESAFIRGFHRWRIVSLSILLFCDPAHAVLHAAPPAVTWVWNSISRDNDGAALFKRSFEVRREIRRAEFKVATDFASARILVDQTVIGELEAFDPPFTADIRQYLKNGRHTVTIQAKGVSGPSAIAALLSIRFQAKGVPPMEIPSDESWIATPPEGRSARTFGIISPARWKDNHFPAISPSAEYNQWREALPEQRTEQSSLHGIGKLPEGFEIEMIHDAGPDEGSWVSMAIDERGRIILAREDRGLLRTKMPLNRSQPIQMETVNDTLKECRGLVVKDHALFANANNSKGLYRLRDTTGDDRYDEVTLLQSTQGGVGHGRNDLAVGPDGWIHAIQGDSVKVPPNARHLAPPEPGAPEELGHWVRTQTDGKIWEIRARGLRNPFGIDFNSDGEAFTYDADNEGDVGLPFYRPTRINHLVSGANYGWHQQEGNTRSMTVYAPDSLPTTCDVGRGSPTAVKFAGKSHFPSPWHEALFALDWAYGRIIAIHLIPRGASYYGSGEVFLEGRPLNVTDLDFDSEGSLLFITGGRKTHSAIYRIRYTGHPSKSPQATVQQMARRKFSASARNTRKLLENFHGAKDPLAVKTAWPDLGNPDPWIRNAARVAVESQPVAQWEGRALQSSGNLQGLTALLALARAGSFDQKQAALIQALALVRPGWTRTEKLSLLRIAELADPAPNSETSRKLRATLEPWLPDIDDPVRRELGGILCPRGSKAAVSAALGNIDRSSNQLERLHYLKVLSTTPDSGWTSQTREQFFRKLGLAKRFSRGDRFMAAFFESLEKRSLLLVGSDLKRDHFAKVLAAASTPEDSSPAPLARPQREFVKHWTISDFSAIDLKTASGKTSDITVGRRMFQAALCDRCHVSGQEGRSVGPDLTQVGRRFTRRDLLLSILEPSQVVAEVHRTVVISRRDGSTVSGRIALDDFRKSTIYLASNPFLPDKLTEIPKSSITSLEKSPVSPMPPGLLDTLTRDEIDALLDWILRSKR